MEHACEITVAFVEEGFRVLVNGVEIKTYSEVILGGIYPLIKQLQYAASKTDVTRARVVGGRNIFCARVLTFTLGKNDA